MATNRLIHVYSGVLFDPVDTDPEQVNIRDIAHSLSLQCRFNGHIKSFYSVAQHSCLAAHFSPRELALTALLHDAAEAYIGDVVSPLKEHVYGQTYRSLEEPLQRTIAEKYGAIYPLPAEVREVDQRLLATERRDLIPRYVTEIWGPWLDGVQPYEEEIVGMPPLGAELTFLELFRILRGDVDG